ncbi:MAG: hypothetical protein E7774_15765 [Bradyrhizobium sp.]|nr:MAG: hypothetical protein E7774_15765 [Bradyrhizobium sp.]
MSGIPPTLPSLAGLGWSATKIPRWSTRVAKHVSGRESRVQNFAYPLYEFELVYDGLDSSGSHYPGLGAYSLQALMGFFQSLGGQFAPFLYVDPTDNYAANQFVALGDGATSAFALQRPLSSAFLEPVGWVTGISGVSVGGVTSTGWSLQTPNTLAFAVPPAVNAPILATFAYAFYCRMSEDALEFEQFMKHLHAVKSFKFSTIRTS